jgi:hypothetical protein
MGSSSQAWAQAFFGVGPPVKVRASARLYPIISYIQELVKKKKKINSLHQQQEPGILWDTNLTEKGIIMKIYEDGTQLKRIADALEEILRLVKADQEKMEKRFEEPRPDLPEDVPFKGRL